MAVGTGWGGEFWLHNGTALAEVLLVTSVTFPEDSVDEIEVTTLKAAGRRKEYISGLIDAGSFDVELNYDPGSTTDLALRAALNAGNTRAWKIVVPDEAGLPERQFTGNGFVKGYKINALRPGEAKTAVLTVKVSGAVTEAAAA